MTVYSLVCAWLCLVENQSGPPISTGRPFVRLFAKSATENLSKIAKKKICPRSNTPVTKLHLTVTRAFNWGSRRSRGAMAGYSPTMEADRRVHKGSHHQIDAIGRTTDRSKPPAKLKVRLRPGCPMCFSTPSPPLRSSPRPSPPLTSAPPRPALRPNARRKSCTGCGSWPSSISSRRS